MSRLSAACVGLLWALSCVAQTSTDQSEVEFWTAVKRPGIVVLMRHALAPGNGDPMEVVIGDCSTQRNLSEEGRQQSRAVGELFRSNGISRAKVHSSQWCRCQETARLLGLGASNDRPSLNSFYGDPSTRDQQTQATLDWLLSPEVNAVENQSLHLLVTHQVNISALTGEYPASGELFAAQWKDGELVVVARLKTR